MKGSRLEVERGHVYIHNLVTPFCTFSQSSGGPMKGPRLSRLKGVTFTLIILLHHFAHFQRALVAP